MMWRNPRPQGLAGTDANELRAIFQSLERHLRTLGNLLGWGGIAAGSVPDVGSAQVAVQCGTNALNTDVNGDATVTLPAPFTTGMILSAAWGSDVAAGPLLCETSTPTLSSFKVRVTKAGVAQAAGTFTLAWMAVGW